MRLKNPEVRIETTSKCNANCTICPREQIKRRKVVMPNDHFRELVDQANSMGAQLISVFGYGEPLTDSGLAKKVKYCTFRGLDTFITTNASLLDVDKIFNLLEAGLTHIRFSVHGIWSKDYEKVHRGLDFTHTLRNIFNFIVVNNDRYKHKCKVSMSVIPMHDEALEHIIWFWEPHVDWLEVWKPHGWAGAKKFRNITEKRKKTCGRPAKGPVQINADGKMMVCCFDSSAKMTVGDTYKESIENILKGEKFDIIRKIHNDWGINESALPCRNCDQLNIGDDPLLYSNRDKKLLEGRTSSSKFVLI